jgi:hypothetical protein
VRRGFPRGRVFNFLRQPFELAEDALGEGLGFGGAEFGGLELMLADPFEEGGLRDLEFDGGAVEAPALGAEQDEAGNGFQIGHKSVDG